VRAAVCHSFGQPRDLRVEERPPPAPKAGEVLVQVEAAGLGYVDALFVRGAYQVKPPLPFIPGSEIAGVIVAVGDGVSGSRAGEPVMAVGHSALSELVALPAQACVRRPDGLSAEAAAASLVSYCTNIYAFETCGALQPDETVLVLGAGGGVGSAAVDLAKGLGAHVVAAASSSEKLELARARGADAVVDYSDPDWRKALQAVLGERPLNIVYDPVGGAYSETAFRSLSPGGRHLVIGFATGEIPRLPLNLPLLKRSSVVGVDWGGHIRSHAGANAPLMARLVELHATGLIQPEPGVTAPLEAAGEVLQALLERRSLGKPVIRMREGKA